MGIVSVPSRIPPGENGPLKGLLGFRNFLGGPSAPPFLFRSDPTLVLSGFPSGPVVKKLDIERIAGFSIIAGPDFPAAQLFPDWSKWVLSRFPPGSRLGKMAPWKDWWISNNCRTGFPRRRTFSGLVSLGIVSAPSRNPSGKNGPLKGLLDFQQLPDRISSPLNLFRIGIHGYCLGSLPDPAWGKWSPVGSGRGQSWLASIPVWVGRLRFLFFLFGSDLVRLWFGLDSVCFCSGSDLILPVFFVTGTPLLFFL